MKRPATALSPGKPVLKKILDDLAHMTVRAFYNDEHIVVIDALIRVRLSGYPSRSQLSCSSCTSL